MKFPPAASTDDTTRSPFARCPTVLMNSRIMDTYLLKIEALISKVWLTRTQCRAIRGRWLDIIEGDDMPESCGPRYVACLARQQYDGAHIVALRVLSCRVPQTEEEDMTRTRTIRCSVPPRPSSSATWVRYQLRPQRRCRVGGRRWNERAISSCTTTFLCKHLNNKPLTRACRRLARNRSSRGQERSTARRDRETTSPSYVPLAKICVCKISLQRTPILSICGTTLRRS